MIHGPGHKALEGRWRVVAVEEDGRRDICEPEDNVTVLIEGNTYLVVEQPDPHPTQFHLNHASHRIDFIVGPGCIIPGIYCLDGDQLMICTNQQALYSGFSGGPFPPPGGFDTSRGKAWRLSIMERLPVEPNATSPAAGKPPPSA